ncbi:MAG: prephenate dehydrogenase, partial [Clostridia bacterium]|nr:prephenate dehydrogenase [Clostridia bacterium]
IVGLGLMGGSYARSLTRQGYHVTAITRNRSSIDYALEQGIIAAGSVQVEKELVAQADLIVFALYPHVFFDWIRDYQHLLTPGTIITDVTGVKTSVVYAIQEQLRDDVEFIASHPMAGRERSGVENSDESIFRGANYIVTPTDKNTPEAISICEALGYTLGFASVSQLSPEEHDDVIGFLSQLTHCIAVTLMTCNDSPRLEDYTGDSFRDLTRIARINDEMWSELFLLNKTALLKNMDTFAAEFNRLREMLAAEDREGMREMMRCSTQRRNRFDKKI